MTQFLSASIDYRLLTWYIFPEPIFSDWRLHDNGDDNHLLIVPILLSLLRPVNQTALLLVCVTRIKDLVSPFVFFGYFTLMISCDFV